MPSSLLPSAHADTFARDRLPPPGQWPELLFALPELQFPSRVNCVAELLDAHVASGRGDRLAIQGEGVHWTFAELQALVNRIANELVQGMGLVSGNRVLLRGANTPMLAACWLAVVKAGGIAVGSMPLLRAKELRQIIDKAEITHALCDARLSGELEMARADGGAATVREVALFHSTAPDGLEARAAERPAAFETVETSSDDVCLMAFTSGTTGVPKATMHFHRDVMAACACFPPHMCCAPRRTTASSAARRWPSPSASAACCCSRSPSAPPPS